MLSNTTFVIEIARRKTCFRKENGGKVAWHNNCFELRAIECCAKSETGSFHLTLNEKLLYPQRGRKERCEREYLRGTLRIVFDHFV